MEVPSQSTPPSEPHQDAAAATNHDDVVHGPATAGPAVVDPGVLRAMEGDFTDRTVVAQFAHDFCDSLDGKIDRVDRLLGSGDVAGAADAVHSVTTSSMMVGALELTRVALEVQGLITGDTLEAARRALPGLRSSAALTAGELRANYPGRSGTS